MAAVCACMASIHACTPIVHAHMCTVCACMRAHSVKYTASDMNNMLIKCQITHITDVWWIYVDVGVVQVSRAILKPWNTQIGFPEGNIRCRNCSGQPGRPGKGQGSYICYPNITKGDLRLSQQLF